MAIMRAAWPIGRAASQAGAKQDLHIQPPRPVVGVFQVKLHPVVEVIAVPSTHLRKAGKAGMNTEAAMTPTLVLTHFDGKRWSWLDQTDITAEYVPKVRQLIQAPATQIASDRTDPGGGPRLKDRASHFVAACNFGLSLCVVF